MPPRQSRSRPLSTVCLNVPGMILGLLYNLAAGVILHFLSLLFVVLEATDRFKNRGYVVALVPLFLHDTTMLLYGIQWANTQRLRGLSLRRLTPALVAAIVVFKTCTDVTLALALQSSKEARTGAEKTSFWLPASFSSLLFITAAWKLGLEMRKSVREVA